MRSGRAASARPSHFPPGSASLAEGRPLRAGISSAASLDRGWSGIAVTVSRVLLGHEAHEEEREETEEDDRLAHGHERPADLLVLERGDPPEARRLDVRVVERRGEEREDEPERAREDECGEEVRRLAARRQVPRLVLEDGPPQEEAGDEVARVLEIEHESVSERGLV